jgi:hypothetical protein
MSTHKKGEGEGMEKGKRKGSKPSGAGSGVNGRPSSFALSSSKDLLYFVGLLSRSPSTNDESCAPYMRTGGGEGERGYAREGETLRVTFCSLIVSSSFCFSSNLSWWREI